MSARSDMRQLAGSGGAPGGVGPPGVVGVGGGGIVANNAGNPAAQHALYASSRHPQHPSLGQRHGSSVAYLNSVQVGQSQQDSPAKLRTHQHAVAAAALSQVSSSAVVVTNPVLSISAAALRQQTYPASAAAAAYHNSNRQQEHLVRYVPFSPAAAAAAVAAGVQQHHPHSSREAFVRGQDLRSSSGPTSSLSATAYVTASSADSRTSSSAQQQQQQQPRISIRQPYQTPHSLYSENTAYLEAFSAAHAAQAQQRAVAAAQAASILPIHHMAQHSASSAASPASGNASISVPGPPDMQPLSKRPRIDLASVHSGSSPAGAAMVAGDVMMASTSRLHGNIAAPLSIDTRETVKQESGYHPQVEQISPTGPEAGNERDELRSTKDDLLQRITKVDREIAKAESHIAKLKKKQQELEDNKANKQNLSDNTDEEERPKNQSIAQIIYADNRKRAKLSHLSLSKLAPLNDLPLYNQPADTDLYFENKRSHSEFKKRLVAHFKKKSEQKEARERYLTETYAKMQVTWTKKVEKIENSKKRKEKEAKSRELYEKIFPELRKQREDKERDHRLGSRGAVRSEADMEDVIERLHEQEMEDKKMHSYAVIPPLLLPPEERRRKFTNNNGLILDPLREFEERKFLNTWTEAEKDIFKEKFLLHPKNFGQIAQFLERKSISDCVQYYYLSKKTENYKQLMRRVKVRRGKRTQQNESAAVAAAMSSVSSGVMTRNRRGDLQQNNDRAEKGGEDSQNASNRSTPQPGAVKQEIKNELEEESSDKRGGRNNKGNHNESSDEEDLQPISGKSSSNIMGGKCSNCPIPSCTTTKGRMKGRLRHLPKKLNTLSKENKDAVNNDLQIPPGTKKCCSTCFQRISKKITQILGNSTCNSPAEMSNRINENSNSSFSTEVPSWSEEDIEQVRTCLRGHGRNWAMIADKMGGRKTAEQCKKFFYNNRKKLGLDKIVSEYKKSNQIGDQPPTLSTEEESGSSTSSCDEDQQPGMNRGPPGMNSPALAADTKLASTGVKTEPIKVEGPIKTEIKVEEGSTSSARNTPAPTGAITLTTTKKEEEYDSAATISADERDTGDNMQARAAALGGANLRPDQRGAYAMTLTNARPPFKVQQTANRTTYPAPIMRPPLATSVTNGPRDTITVKELLINVIEQSLSTPGSPQTPAGAANVLQAGHDLPANSMPPSVSPTIKSLLAHSDPTPHKSAAQYGRDRSALPPHQKGSMAPPPAPQQQLPSGGECETLDLSMPRKRESVSPSQASLPGQNSYREPHPQPPLHPHARGSPSIKSEFSAGASSNAPPPAHAGNKVKTNPDPYYRGEQRQAPSPVVFGPDGRPLSSPHQHIMHRSVQSPGLTQRSNPSLNSSRPATVQYVPRHSSQPVPAAKGSSISPKVGGATIGRPLSIQTGSITQGTPVNQQMRYDSLVKANPGDKPGGSITHGTPYEKKHQQVINVSEHPIRHDSRGSAEYYRRTVSPGSYPGGYPTSAAASATAAAAAHQQQQNRSTSYVNDSHLSSRQVIMNDFAMARSTEMQRRPDSRDHPGSRSISPANRILSRESPGPRIDPRFVSDPRAQLELRRDSRNVDPRTYDHRVFDPRLLSDPRGDPKAEIRALDQRSDPRLQHDIRTDPRLTIEQRSNVRGDPRAGLEVRGDPRAVIDHRSNPRSGLDFRGDPRSVIDPRSELRITHEVHNRRVDARTDQRAIIDPRMQLDPRDHRNISSFPQGYPQHTQAHQVYMTADGKYVHSSALQNAYPSSSRSRSPMRAGPGVTTSPPQRSSATVLHRTSLGGITSGKPIVAQKPGPLGNREVEIYRTSNTEVTISKTNSPRHTYTDHNPLASLVDVAVQQPKLPDLKERERVILHQQHLASSSGAPVRLNYDRQMFERSRTAASLASTTASSSLTLGSTQQHPSSLVQQVQTERAKQTMYLLQDKERDYSTPSSSATIVSRPFAPNSATVTPTSRDDRAKMTADKTMTAAKLIENIITHSINLGPAPDGGAIPLQAKQGVYRRSPAEVAALTPQEEAAAAKTNSPHKIGSRSPSSLKGDVTNGPEEGGHSSAPGSRPGSRSSSVAEHPEGSQESINSEQYWKRRGMPPSSMDRSHLNTMPAPRTAGALVPVSSDERQITRVSAQDAISSRGQMQQEPVVEPISPPTNERISPSSAGIPADAMARFLDARKRSPDKPGMSPLDYVKNKIVEEMRKEPSGNASVMVNTTSASNSSSAGVKRQASPAEKVANGRECGVSPPKKASTTTSVETAAAAPDSPGSEGEMVIDETARPDSAGNDHQPTKQPTPSPTMGANSSTAEENTIKNHTTDANKSNSSKPRYEPLSDDE